ncbi:MAG: glutamine-hydrolyzing carbamoyl-phosphate synthase small subunit [Patescibacteria group bacterium]|nr:glutamine-hydrolyzing carbamoyl-phosphate synthase small subunit [Patescibacteria group bacterium]MDE1965774.1 glutamine-hydrolyzing carbamoyl-phosphate synthase small subunit [Patescibacteria group bacterium]
MTLSLADGTTVEGSSFGAPVSVSAEVVFNTGMVGYVESLSDPSYAGQILVLTYPLVGNYGVPSPESFESKKIHAAGLVVAEYVDEYSNHTAVESLSAWLTREGIPAMSGVDTRALTKILREHGVMEGRLNHSRAKRENVFSTSDNFVAKVSPEERTVEGEGDVTILAVDCGMKENIVRSLRARGARVIRVPWDYDFSGEAYDGVLLSNGPGDPMTCAATVANVRKAFEADAPMLGICLGTQMMALAAGAKTYKLKYGHRAQNQPCALSGTERCFITSQNHGYAVDAKTLPKDWEVWFANANDGSVEGIRHKTKPFRAVQFHPEAAPGPTDTAWVFDEFLASVRKRKKAS